MEDIFRFLSFLQILISKDWIQNLVNLIYQFPDLDENFQLSIYHRIIECKPHQWFFPVYLFFVSKYFLMHKWFWFHYNPFSNWIWKYLLFPNQLLLLNWGMSRMFLQYWWKRIWLLFLNYLAELKEVVVRRVASILI